MTAPIAGSGPRGNCTGKVAAWIAHGNQDMVVAYASGQRSRDTWVMSNMCQTTTQPGSKSATITAIAGSSRYSRPVAHTPMPAAPVQCGTPVSSLNQARMSAAWSASTSVM